MAVWIALLTGLSIRAQDFTPTRINGISYDGNGEIKLMLPTIPGKYYEVLRSDNGTFSWNGTITVAFTATTTRAELFNGIGPPARFYKARERAPVAPNTAPISTTAVGEAEKLLGLSFTSAQRNQMIAVLDELRAEYESVRATQLLNRDPPPWNFNPLPAGFMLDTTQQPISWSPPTRLTVPTNQAELAFCSVRDLAGLIRSRQLKSMDLTRLYLERLKRYDPLLLCVVSLTEELALNQAAQADAEIAAGRYRGHLHGIPYGIKDLFSTRGYPTTWGAAPYRDQRIEEDAEVIRRLKAAGAVLVAKLSLGSLANGDVWFGGRTRNPWDPTKGSGGSSAGSAAATAAGLVAFAIGTETLGSILVPAATCRVTGLRPTFGRVSRTGAMSLSWSLDKIGPLCREVEDCALVLNAIRGPDGVDESVMEASFNYNSEQDLRQLRVAYLEGSISADSRNRLAALVAPSQLVPIVLPNLPVIAMANTISLAEAGAAFDELTRFRADVLLDSQDLWDWPNLLRAARTIPAVEYLQANRVRTKLVQALHTALKDVDLYVTHGADPSVLLMGNLAGLPAVVIPNGSGAGLAFVGKPFAEAAILALAKAYQDTTTHHLVHPPLFAQ